MLVMNVRKARSLHGTVTLPGDKSISHRSALIASLADGETRVRSFAASADCASTIACLQAIGVETRWNNGDLIVRGVGRNGFRPPDGPLDCGNSGTTMRLITGILAGQGFDSVLTGDGSLRSRPMTRIIEPLTLMGAEIRSDGGKAPLRITGRTPLKAISYRTPVASAQVKSCILLAGLFAEGETSVAEDVPTRDHTERMLRWFGVTVCSEMRSGRMVHSVSGGQTLKPRDLVVPADISAAAFFLSAAAGIPGSDLTLPNVGVNPTRNAVLDVLIQSGARIELSDHAGEDNEPTATLRVKGGLANTGKMLVVDGPVIANLIDEIPVLAVLGTQLEKGLEVRDAAELRVKESDRINAVVENLRRMKADVEEFPDGFRVTRSDLHGAEIDSFGDHRIAMAFAVAGLFADGKTTILRPECVDVSFPGFFQTLAGVVSS
jgi:3-phosphoshikimate 1-carboxyvinyltransferase